MKTIARRVSKLEERFAPQVDEAGRSPADVLRERLRRRLIAEGRNPEEFLREDFVDADYQPRTIVEVLRSRFRRRKPIDPMLIPVEGEK
jgi:hypothetical protein